MLLLEIYLRHHELHHGHGKTPLKSFKTAAINNVPYFS